MTHSYDVAILGAGIAGSSLAKWMSDLGWDTVLIDRKSFPRHKVCGEFLSPEAMGTLEFFGIRELVDRLQPTQITSSQLIFQNGAVLDLALPGPGIGISRYLLDMELHKEAERSGVKLYTKANVISVHAADEEYTVVMKQEKEKQALRAKVVIAAWGANARSKIASGNMEQRRQAHSNKYMGVKSHYLGIHMEPVVELYFFDGGYLGLCPVENGIVNVAALLNRKKFTPTDKSIAGLIKEACRRNPMLEKRLASAISVPESETAVAPVDVNRKLLTWDITPLIGDAAVMIPPLCGDGMSMALTSAMHCGTLADRFLRGSISMEEWRREYSRSLHQQFDGPLRWGRVLQSLFGIPWLSPVLPVLAHSAPVLTNALLQATRLTNSHS